MPISLQELAKPTGLHLNVHFTERQLQVLNLLTMGYTRKEVCFILDLSKPTIDTHIWSLLEKFNLETINGLLIAGQLYHVTNPLKLEIRAKSPKKADFIPYTPKDYQLRIDRGVIRNISKARSKK